MPTQRMETTGRLMLATALVPPLDLYFIYPSDATYPSETLYPSASQAPAESLFPSDNLFPSEG